MPNWKKVIVSGSNASLNSLTVTTNVTAHSLTGSLFGTASYAVNALTASYALNARDSVVTVAKDNITQGTASYFNFTGSGVTVTTTNGTSSINIPGATTIGGQGTSVLHTQSSPSTTWNFTHNLGSTYVTYDIFDASNNAIIPQTVNATLNTLTITFSTPQSGYAVATVGGGLPTISASYANYILAVNQTGTAAQWVSASGLSVNSASFATTASYAFNAITASHALTASYVNPLVQNVIITGSLIVSGSSTFTNIGPANLNGNTTVTGSLGVLGNIITTGDITAQTLIVSTVSSSVVYSSGSNIFGNNLSNTQQLTGSVSITGSLTVNNIDLLASSASFSTRTTNLESTSSVLTTASASFAVVSGSYSSMSGSTSTRVTNLENASGSFSTRVTNTEVTASSLVLASGSFSTRVTGLESASGSFSTRVTTLETASGSFSTRVTNTEATASNLVPRVTNTEATASSLVTASGSASTRLTNLETASGSLSTRVTNTEATASNLVPRVVNLESTSSNLTNASASFSTRVTSAETNITNLQTASGSFSTRVTNTEATASNLVPRVVNLESTASSLVNASSSFSTRVTSTETSITTLTNASSSFAAVSSSYSPMSGSTSTRVTSLETASGSFSTRVTTLETASGSFSTRVTSAETNITNLQTASGSFSTRVTSAETNITNLQTSSGSFSTRVTSVEGSVNLLNSKTGSYAVTASNQFKADQSITGSLLVTGNVGIGTTTPGAKLEVVLPANTLSHIFRSTASENLLSIQTFPTTNRMQLLVGDYNGTSAPNIAAISDSNTGIQWAGSDVIRFVNGGSENVTINASGNVGIGTTSPSTKLDVNGTIKTGGNGGGYVEGYRIIWETPDSHRNIGSNAYQIENVTSQGLTIGYAANQFVVINASGSVGIGSISPAYKLDVNGTARVTTLIETSSKRYKKNIKTLPSQLEVINELRPVTFKWKDKAKGEDTQYGLIAEEVQTIVPEAVALNDKGETEAVSYTKLVPILIKAVQELQAKVEALENKRQ